VDFQRSHCRSHKISGEGQVDPISGKSGFVRLACVTREVGYGRSDMGEVCLLYTICSAMERRTWVNGMISLRRAGGAQW
jgi:hypothetical protein